LLLLGQIDLAIIDPMQLVAEKICQAGRILDELGIDAWLVFVRESRLQADPVMPLVVGGEATWPSYFLYSRTGRAYAIVGDFDEEIFKSGGRFTEVRTYTEDGRQAICDLLAELDPKSIALNYSTGDPAADGLTHGMFQLLLEHLQETPYVDRLCPSEEVVTKLRSRKLPEEMRRLEQAAGLATQIWDQACQRIRLGMSEIEVADLIEDLMRAQGVKPSFQTAVNAGDKTAPGHGPPTDVRIAAGDLLHIDFGVVYKDFCSDLQRLIYFQRPGEKGIPAELRDAFDLINEVITESARECLPGRPGWEVDSVAREMLRDHGFPEYQHALGHQLGRSVHDGGGIIGPKWARYRHTPLLPLELNSVFTLELEIVLPGIGCVGLEEDVCITEKGASFLCPRQQELIVR
jgi:Xaa-Pro aminopeptidase